MSNNNEAKSNKLRAKIGNFRNIGLIICGIVIFAIIAFFGLKLIGKLDNGSKMSFAKQISYRTIAKVELHEANASNSPISAVLKENSIVSGKPIGKVDGVEWAEITSVDGAHGFLPLSSLEKIGDGADLGQVKEQQRRIITSTSINMRSVPSLSGAIIGTIDGGTRLMTDGYVSSQGEDWLRLRVGSDTTAFIMARFTTPDDERSGSSEGFIDSNLGVPGSAKIVTNVQATPFPDGRIIKSLLIGDKLGVIGETKTDDYWYIVRLSDGSQGFVPKSAISVSIKVVKTDESELKKSSQKDEKSAQDNKMPSADNPVKVDFGNNVEEQNTDTIDKKEEKPIIEPKKEEVKTTP